MPTSNVAYLKQLLAAGKVNRVFDELAQIALVNVDFDNPQLLGLKYRFTTAGKDYASGKTTAEHFRIERANVFQGLLDLIAQLPPNELGLFQQLTHQLEEITDNLNVRKALAVFTLSLMLIVGYFLYQKRPIQWKIATTWLKNDKSIIYKELVNFKKEVYEHTNHRLKLVFSVEGEMGFETKGHELFTQVHEGKIDGLYSIAYNWINYDSAKSGFFFAAVPFGKEFEEYDDWLEFGGGNTLWQAYYDHQKWNVKPFALGHTGKQFGGWFEKELNRSTLRNLRMRIPPLQGELLTVLGAGKSYFCTQEKITASMKDSVQIGAFEWLGAYEDVVISMNKEERFRHYYKEGWHEEDTLLELLVNKDSYERLPKDIQLILTSLIQKYNHRIYTKFFNKNREAWENLVSEKGKKETLFHLNYPTDIKKELKLKADSLFRSEEKKDKFFSKVYESYKNHAGFGKNWDKSIEDIRNEMFKNKK